MTKRLNVRCSTKVFGTLEVPDSAVRCHSWTVYERPVFMPIPGRIEDIPDIWELPRRHEIRIKAFCELRGDDWAEELAVYSDDRPIEFWRKIPGFVEGDHV